MMLTFYSLLFSVISGALIIVALLLLKKYLLEHCAYNVVIIFSCVAAVRFLVLIEIPVFLTSFSNAINGLIGIVEDVAPITLPSAQDLLSFSQARIFLIIWFFGSVILTLVTLAKHLTYVWNSLARVECDDPDVLAEFERIKMGMGISKTIRIIQSNECVSPYIAGFFIPTIHIGEICPLSNEFSSSLRHELTHYKNRDLWILFAITLIRNFLWWNPFVWLLLPIIRETCEYRCDQMVSGYLNETEVIDYAIAINRIDGVSKRKGHYLGLSMYDSPPIRKSDAASKRIAAIFNKPRRLRKSTLIALLSIVSIVSFVSLAFSSAIIVHELEQFPVMSHSDTTTNSFYLVDNFNGTFDLYIDGIYVDKITKDHPSFNQLRTIE